MLKWLLLALRWYSLVRRWPNRRFDSIIIVIFVYSRILWLSDRRVAILLLSLALPVSQMILVGIDLPTICSHVFLIVDGLGVGLRYKFLVLIRLWLINWLITVLGMEGCLYWLRLVKGYKSLTTVQLEALRGTDTCKTSLQQVLLNRFDTRLTKAALTVYLTSWEVRILRAVKLWLGLKGVCSLDLLKDLISLLESLSKHLLGLNLLLLLLLLKHLQ